MAIQKEESIKEKRSNLLEQKENFMDFLRDIYEDKHLEDKMREHIWRIDRQIEILDWVLNDELPF